jgi:putative CocE/NonD family hydrolase
MKKYGLLLALFCLVFVSCSEQKPASNLGINEDSLFVRDNYTKMEVMVPMRDGIKLFTSIYIPKDQSEKYPILLKRTPYGVAPYGDDNFGIRIGPSMDLVRDKYIFVSQDVRGRYMSEGTFTWMAPHTWDESWDEGQDTWDTIEWLINNIENNNGKVGTYGGSYPGFYVVAGMIDAHPALKAAIPSAPMADLWKGDDVSHNGAFLMPHNLGFLSRFGLPRPEPLTQYPAGKTIYNTPDGYKFWLDFGPLRNVNEKLFHGEIIHWNEYIQNPVYNEFWQSRNMLQYLTDVKPAVLTIGGWFDAQDLYGPLKVFESIEKQSPSSKNGLIMGPWYHGSWSSQPGDKSAAILWRSLTGEFYRKEIEFPFYSYHLKDKSDIAHLPKAWMFNTGRKEWQKFDSWPPKAAQEKNLYLQSGNKLSFNAPTEANASDTYMSDPKKPVPFTTEITTRYGNDWMLEDQRFASRRPDVLVFETDVLEEDITISGELMVHLWASTSGSDQDFVVKVIDVHPADYPDPDPNPYRVKMGGYEMLLRGGPIRAKFRNSLEKPEPMRPNMPEELVFELRDVFHTFKKGHKIMVHVQSTWFPMIDLNPGKFVDLFNDAKEEDFQKTTQRIYFEKSRPSYIRLRVLE